MASIPIKIIRKVVRSVRYRLDRVCPNYLGDKYQCPLCLTKLAHFQPLPMYYFQQMHEQQYIHSISRTETLNIESYSCPVCYCSDRDRLYYLYIKRILQQSDKTKKFRLVDIAPSASLRKVLSQEPAIEYRCADLLMEDVDDKIDLTDMCAYPDESFDIFICSHVLEHINDDTRAMRELYRILSKGGWGIAMVPINLGLEEVYENQDVTSEAEKWKHFGQDDHVRMYSKQGFVNRLISAGFQVEQVSADYFGPETFEKFGIHSRSVLYIVRK